MDYAPVKRHKNDSYGGVMFSSINAWRRRNVKTEQAALFWCVRSLHRCATAPHPPRAQVLLPRVHGAVDLHRIADRVLQGVAER